MKLVTEHKLSELISQSATYQRIDNFLLSEPRLRMIQKRLQALLEVIQFEADGEPVEVDGFSLKNIKDWISEVGPPTSDMWYISTACNIRCPFCYEEGDPDFGSVISEPTEMISLKEIDTRLKYRDYQNGMGIFQPLTYINEIFCHPEALNILKRIRQNVPSHQILTFVTNGTYLTEEVIREIAQLKPIYFNFSVNSLSESVRRRILRDKNPEVAIKAIKLLAEYGIPYLGSLVCWPTIPWDDIRNTIFELDKYGCSLIRFSLSAYSKHLKGRKFDRKTFWAEGIAVAEEMMKQVSTPIKIEPYHYWNPSYQPYVAGVIKGSPAYAAGVQVGDLITQIDQRNIQTANQALGVLASSRKKEELAIQIMGPNGEKNSMVLSHQNSPIYYPYAEMTEFAGFEWGILVIDNLKFQYLKEMRSQIDQHQARNVLLCTSEIMAPIVSDMIFDSQAFQDVHINLGVPENKFFGGTVVLGDLLVAEDYIDFINAYLETVDSSVDLIIIPTSAFSTGPWKRDLKGVPYHEIRRKVNKSVAFINCVPING